jgi:hypothetical protein
VLCVLAAINWAVQSDTQGWTAIEAWASFVVAYVLMMWTGGHALPAYREWVKRQ